MEYTAFFLKSIDYLQQPSSNFSAPVNRPSCIFTQSSNNTILRYFDHSNFDINALETEELDFNDMPDLADAYYSDEFNYHTNNTVVRLRKDAVLDILQTAHMKMFYEQFGRCQILFNKHEIENRDTIKAYLFDVNFQLFKKTLFLKKHNTFFNGIMALFHNLTPYELTVIRKKYNILYYTIGKSVEHCIIAYTQIIK